MPQSPPITHYMTLHLGQALSLLGQHHPAFSLTQCSYDRDCILIKLCNNNRYGVKPTWEM